MQYKQWLDEWLNTIVKPLRKLRTYQSYCEIANQHLIPNLGEYEMDFLSASVLQNFTAQITTKYSANTVNAIITVLKSSLQLAETTGITQRQYSGSIQYPKREEKQIECFSAAEQRKIEQFIIGKKKIKLYGVLLCLYTGIRIGELLALEWKDVDLPRGLITVSKTCHDSWEDGKYKKIIATPKTRSSIRVIPVPRRIIPYLREMKKKSCGAFVVSGNEGEGISIRSYQRTFELLLVHLKIRHKGFHSLRHTFATRAIECGMDVRTLSEILGHNNPTVTLKRYVHSLMEHKCAMMNKLAKNLE